MPFWNSDSANNNQTPSAEKPAINSGDHAQPKQIGDHITQHTPVGPGITDNELARQLRVTEAALKNFLGILEQQDIPIADLRDELKKLAERHRELEKRVNQLEADDPEVIALQKKAREAIANARYEQAEDLLEKSAEWVNLTAEKIKVTYLKRKRLVAENMALKAEALHTRFAWNETIKAYQQAISFAGEATGQKKNWQSIRICSGAYIWTLASIKNRLPVLRKPWQAISGLMGKIIPR